VGQSQEQEQLVAEGLKEMKISVLQSRIHRLWILSAIFTVWLWILAQCIHIVAKPADTRRLRREPNPKKTSIVELHNCKMTNACCFKLLRLWSFVTQQEITSTDNLKGDLIP
jgi:hypothetical protein